MKPLTKTQFQTWQDIAWEYHTLTFRGLFIPLSSTKMFAVRQGGCFCV